MQQTRVRRAAPIAALVLAVASFQACGGDSDAPADSHDASSGSETFVIGSSGTTHTLTLPNGQKLTFEFPASAAGEKVTLRIVDDASYGLEGQHPNLVEMLPHGTAFSPPVLVTPDWSGAVPVLRTFADAAAAVDPEILPIAKGKRAFELAHFSLLSVNAIDYNCPFPGTDKVGISTLCKSTQHEQTFYCDNTTLCRAIRAHCCVDIVGNPNLACTELLDYAVVPINAPPCGQADAGTDATPDVVDSGGNDADTGAGGSGGSGAGGAGGGGGSGGGTVGGCPQTGKYSVAATGACGDLNIAAPNQRLDGIGCGLYWEYDGGPASKGVGSGNLTYSASGVTPGLPINLGSATYTCTATAAHPSVTLACTGPGSCNVSLVWTAPL